MHKHIIVGNVALITLVTVGMITVATLAAQQSFGTVGGAGNFKSRSFQGRS